MKCNDCGPIHSKSSVTMATDSGELTPCARNFWTTSLLDWVLIGPPRLGDVLAVVLDVLPG
jgi:hypothetical protein